MELFSSGQGEIGDLVEGRGRPGSSVGVFFTVPAEESVFVFLLALLTVAMDR